MQKLILAIFEYMRVLTVASENVSFDWSQEKCVGETTLTCQGNEKQLWQSRGLSADGLRPQPIT